MIISSPPSLRETHCPRNRRQTGGAPPPPSPLPEKGARCSRPRPHTTQPCRRSMPLARTPTPTPIAVPAPTPVPRFHATTVPVTMEDKRYQARPLVLPPNLNRRKTPTLKRPARTGGIDVGLSYGKFIVPFGAPTKPVAAAFNKMLVQLYNMTADLKGILEEVNATDPQLLQAILDQVNRAHPEFCGPENKDHLCSFLRKGVNGFRSKACAIRSLVMEMGSKPINEPLDWNRM